MVDTRTPEQRRRIMAAVRSTDTAPELRLRRALYAAGVRGWRCHYKGAPGKPDLAWPSLRVAVFVDGAFWHGHPSRHRPGRSGEYWDEKIARNVERDRQTDAALKGNGWIVVRIWDFELASDLEAVVERVSGALRERTSGGAGPSQPVDFDERTRRIPAPSTRVVKTTRIKAQSGTQNKRSSAIMQPMSHKAGPDHHARAQTFGANLRDARYKKGLSQDELSKRSGVDRGAISNYERGRREPNLSTIAKLAHALEAPVATLVRGL